MDAVALLLLLLVAAYLGSAWSTGRAIRGFGLASGVEWMLLGVAVGPHALGLFDSSTIHGFEPLVIAGLGWVALVVGIDHGYIQERRVRARALVLGWCSSLLGLATVGGATWLLQVRYLGRPAREAAIVSLALALVTSETTRHAVRWAVEHHRARGPLATRLADIAATDDGIPIVGLAVLVAATVTPSLSVPFPFGWRLAATLALGVCLGLVAAALLAKNLAFGESWTVLLATAALAVGVSMRMGMAALSVSFIAGTVISRVSHRHDELRTALAPTERPVMLPILLLAGASLELTSADTAVQLLAAAAVAARVLVKLLAGGVISRTLVAHHTSPLLVGLALLPSGTLAMCLGSYIYLQVGDELGNTVLWCAVAAVFLGELIGPTALKRALSEAGELAEATPSSPKQMPREAAR